MNIIPYKIKPIKGYAHVYHLLLSLFLPALVFVLVRMDFVQLAVSVVLLSKWRMFAVRMRFWPAITRASSVDIIVGLSTVVFLSHTTSLGVQLALTVMFGLWQVWIKPGRSTFSVSSQSLIGQVYGLTALFIGWPDASLAVIVAVTWIITHFSIRHYFGGFEEPNTYLYSFIWAYFTASFAWVGAHWMLFYGVVSQVSLLLNIIALGLGSLYFLDKTDRYSKSVQYNIAFITVSVVVIILVFSDWGSKIV